jgi:hypothetical protein
VLNRSIIHPGRFLFITSSYQFSNFKLFQVQSEMKWLRWICNIIGSSCYGQFWFWIIEFRVGSRIDLSGFRLFRVSGHLIFGSGQASSCPILCCFGLRVNSNRVMLIFRSYNFILSGFGSSQVESDHIRINSNFQKIRPGWLKIWVGSDGFFGSRQILSPLPFSKRRVN